ncbi:MAG: redox-sensing transcriptional repressor Rex [Acutalibacteraceae bacterium]|nr:redox-sensing transcriptional repressor Rex [Acutalibacteraceae bacterium]
MAYRSISPSVIRRLPRYYRFLKDLEGQGITRISSAELSRKMGLTASQIRQDLNCFGGFGQQGYGYNVQLLIGEIAKILCLDNPQKLIIIGIGNLGRAIATHIRFDNKGYELIGLFDQKESLVGQIVHNLPIRSMDSLDEFCKENKPTAAVLCIPKESAEAIAYKLVKLGIKGFLNFSHYDLGLAYPNVSVENVHFGDKLMVLSYNMNNKEN